MGLACTKHQRKLSAENPNTAPADLRTPSQPVHVPAELLKGGGGDPYCVLVSQALERRLAAYPSTSSRTATAVQAGHDPYFDKPELFQGVAGGEGYPPMRPRRATISGGELILEGDGSELFCQCPPHEGQGDRNTAQAAGTASEIRQKADKMTEDLEKVMESVMLELQKEEHQHVESLVRSATAACRRAITDCYGGYRNKHRSSKPSVADEVVRCRATVDEYKAAVRDMAQRVAAMKAAVEEAYSSTRQSGAHAKQAVHAVSFANPVVTEASGAGPQVTAEPTVTSVSPACEVTTSSE